MESIHKKIIRGRKRISFSLPKFSRRIYAGIFAIATFSAFSILIINKVLAAPTEPIPSIELTSQYTSYADDESGAWKVNKMAGWTGSGTARIIMDVDSLMKLPEKDSDVLLVVDRGSSMSGEKLTAVKDALTRLTNEFLDEGNNTLSLVTFDHDYTIETEFTNDRDLLLSKISGISTTSGNTNYYQGLNGAERVLCGYTQQDDRNAIVVFLTDGSPNEELLYQAAEYWLIKYKYPYITVNAIQYDIGTTIISDLASISDNQFVADQDTIKDVIFDATVAPYAYDDFILTDYINDEFFTISGVDAIEVDRGTVSLDYDGSTPKITWDMSGELRSGSTAHMEIDINLKDAYITEPGLYPTNKSTSVVSSLFDTPTENVVTDSTPILKTDYKVTYAANAPSDCEVSGVPEQETHFVYTTVEITDTVPTCSGYNFAGYKIVEDQVTKLNDDYFRMPEKDVTLGATWTKVDLDKRMEGTVYVAKTLYNEIAKKSLIQGSDGAYHLDSGLNFADSPSTTNGQGVNTIASTASDEYPVHYFRGNVSDNNVLFAGVCWKAMRTTSTGGVKLVYNGEADSNGQCGSSRSTHNGFDSRTLQNLASNYYYGTDFTYNESTKTFTLSGVKSLAKWDATTGDSLVGQYTCKSTDENASCSTMYYLESKYNATTAYVLPLNTNTPYYSIGTTQFNAHYNNNYPYSSPAYVGYMYGDVYSANTMTISTSTNYVSSTTVLPGTSLSTSFWYADTITYGTDVSGKYSLTDPYQVSSTSDYSSLLGKYTFRASQSDYHNNVIYYIAAVNGSTMYYLQMSNGQTLPDVDTSYMIGDSITDNGNGTYTLNNATAVKKSEWGSEYNNIKSKFTCDNSTNTTCNNPQYIQNTTAYSYSYSYSYIPVNSTLTIGKSRNGFDLVDTTTVKLYELSQNPSDYSEYKYTCGSTATTCTASTLKMITAYTATKYSYVNNAVFGASAEWDGTNYTLTDPQDLESYNNMTDISMHHYICPTFGQTTCSQVRYVYYYTGSGSADFITLSNGIETPDEALAKMKENNTNSIIKSAVDAWYAHTLTEYADMIEDTQYCNDRRVSTLGGWNPDGGMTNQYLYFGADGRNYSPYQPSLDCSTNDAFTVDSANGNGKLTYPVGLLSEDELTLAGHGTSGYSSNSYLYTGSGSWSLSPNYFNNNNANEFNWNTNSSNNNVNNTNAVRPVVSIAPGTLISNGDGSVNNPWVLE